MRCKQYNPATDNTMTDLKQVGRDTDTDVNSTQPGRMSWGGESSFARGHSLPLQSVGEGILGGVCSLQFMDSIDTWSERLGNRAFMRWVAGLRSGEQLPDMHEVATGGLRGVGRPLTHLGRLQRAFGHHDIQGMREFTDSAAGSALDTLGAEGYTSGNRMALLGPPDLYVQAHEAAHGVQQAGLGSRMQLRGGTGEAGDRYERQADAVAEAVVKGQSAEPLLDEMVGHSTQVAPVAASTGTPVQMKWPDKNLEDLTGEEFDAAIEEMTDEELDEAWEELTLLLEIAELEEEEVKSKPQAKAKKEKKGKSKLTKEEREAVRLARTKQSREMQEPADTTPQPAAGSKKQKQQKKAPAQKGGAGKAGVLTLDQMPGLRDMFLSRAINHLITGELYKLDSMVGDEGCQLRTPFTLDLYELVQDQLKKSPYQSSAYNIVGEYSKATDTEQASVIARMKELERMRVRAGERQKQQYEDTMSQFIGSNALQASMAAKSGPYEDLFNYLITAIERSWPGAGQYLEYLASETLFWGNRVDPFGVSMGPFIEPIFPDATLAKRKIAQAEYSKNYFVKALSELLRIKGINVESKKVVAGYSKMGEEERLFEIPTSEPENILSMLLYSIQLCTASISIKHRDLPLIQSWESLRSLLPMYLAKGRPIIVNLRRIISAGPEEEPIYTSDLSESLFYEPSPGGYQYQPNPSVEQQQQGAFVISGFSMLRQGDHKMREGGLNIAPWLFEEDPKKFKEGFTSVPVSSLIFLGGIKHPPLNVGATGSKALALSPEESAQSTNKTKTRGFGGSSENSFPYAEALHRVVLEKLGQTGMTRAGQRWLTPDYQLTDTAKNLVFPDQSPIDVTGSQPQAVMNISEEFQLLLRLAEAANQEDVRYAMDSREAPGEVIRLANQTIPFSIKHIYASTFQCENAISQHYARTCKEAKAGKRHKISELYWKYH